MFQKLKWKIYFLSNTNYANSFSMQYLTLNNKNKIALSFRSDFETKASAERKDI